MTQEEGGGVVGTANYGDIAALGLINFIRSSVFFYDKFLASFYLLLLPPRHISVIEHRNVSEKLTGNSNQ